ncbi:MAG: lytic transglycosylase domain-containing protein [Pseudomonadota bacterium]
MIPIFCAALLLTASPAPVEAQGFGGSRAGSFKVVKPPARGARKRLTIHGIQRATPPGTSRRSSRHTWFWQEASPAITAADATRFASLAAVASTRIGSAAHRALVKTIAQNFGTEIAAAARNAKISEALLIAVIAAESRGQVKAVSPAGAQGLAQLMPGTAQRFNVNDPFDPAQNLRGSADYLSILLGMFSEDTLLALAGYNAGENAVIRHNGVPPYAETRDYVPIVLSYWHAAQQLCEAAPSGPRAPCTTAALP